MGVMRGDAKDVDNGSGQFRCLSLAFGLWVEHLSVSLYGLWVKGLG